MSYDDGIKTLSQRWMMTEKNGIKIQQIYSFFLTVGYNVPPCLKKKLPRIGWGQHTMMILRQSYLVLVLRIHKMSNMRVTRMRSSCSPSFFLTMLLNCSIYLVSYTFHYQLFFTLAKNRFPDRFTLTLIGENLPAGCLCLWIILVPPWTIIIINPTDIW